MEQFAEPVEATVATATATAMASEPEPQPQPQPQRLRFHATGSEYFRIWIVNLLLSIATLGVYSAWAKVRRNQYLYSCTELAGCSFEYHGSPGAILRGRIVAVIIFGGYNLAFRISPTAGFSMLAIMAVVMPWLTLTSLKFRLYNTSYRGLRFCFDGTLRAAYVNYLLLPLLCMFTLLVFSPALHQRLKRFQHSQSRYGQTRFAFHATVFSFYKRYGVCLWAIVCGLVLLWLTQIGFLASANKPGGLHGLQVKQRWGVILLCAYVWLMLVWPLFLSLMQNLIWNQTSLGPHRFRSEMRWGRLALISVTNYLAILCTLGFYTPYAQIRTLRYRLESMTLLVDGSLDDFVAADSGQASASAAGVGAADLFNLDISL